MNKYIIVPVEPVILQDIKDIVVNYSMDMWVFLDYFLENYSGWYGDNEQCTAMLYEYMVNQHELSGFQYNEIGIQEHEENIFRLEDLVQQLFGEVNRFLASRKLDGIECFSLDRVYGHNQLAFKATGDDLTNHDGYIDPEPVVIFNESTSGSLNKFLGGWVNLINEGHNA